MKCTLKSMSATLLFSITTVAFAQSSHPIVEKMVDETYQNSQLEKLGYELIDKIGPRLVGSPKMQQAHDWAVNQFKSWGISAKNEPWGEWRSWERGTSQITLTQPYIKSLEGDNWHSALLQQKMEWKQNLLQCLYLKPKPSLMLF